jgi:nucleoside-diphosphate-sugar epimerase
VFINATGNNRGYEVNKAPHEDCDASICTTYNTLFDFDIDKYIYFSSIAVEDKNSNYGFNKLLTEQIILRYAKNPTILRCSAVIDKTSELGLIADILNGKELFVTPKSKYQFITRNEVVRIVKEIVDAKRYNYSEIYNLGGLGSIQISDIESMISIPVKYAENATYRHYEMNVMNAHDAFYLKSTKEYVEEIVNG